MSELSLTDIRDFNRCLKTLHAAGVPLHLNAPASFTAATTALDSSTPAKLNGSLSAMEASLASAVTQGVPLELAFEQQNNIPQSYRHALMLWQQSGRQPQAFEPLTVAAQSGRRLWGRQIVSLVQPLIVMVLAYVCLVFICVAVAPLFVALSQQTQSQPGPFLTTLLWLRSWLPVWALVAPVGIVAVALKPLYRWRRLLSHSRWSHAEHRWLAQAHMATRAQIAGTAEQLLKRGLAPADTLEWVRHTIGDAAPMLATSPSRPTSPALMAWATTDSQTDSRPALSGTRLRMAAGLYSATREALANPTCRYIQPRLAFIVLGGLLVLAIASLVFGPLIEMLLSVSLPTGIPQP